MADKRLILTIFTTQELQHLPGLHWILASVDPLQATITIFNSLKSENDPMEITSVNALQKFFTYRLLKQFKVVHANVSQQENNYDCGIFG